MKNKYILKNLILLLLAVFILAIYIYTKVQNKNIKSPQGEVTSGVQQVSNPSNNPSEAVDPKNTLSAPVSKSQSGKAPELAAPVQLDNI